MGLFSWWRGKTITPRDGGFWSAYFNGESWSGESVGHEQALQVAAWWACVRLISQTVSTLPLGIFESLDNGDRQSRKDHPLYDLLHNSPNADQTAVEFWEGQILALCTGGNSFSEKAFSGNRLVALQPWDANHVRVDRDEAGALQYELTDRGKVYKLPGDKVFHIRGFGGGDLGLSPVSYARQTLGITVATEKAAGKSFAHGMRASGFFTAPPNSKLSPEQREQFRDTFIRPYIGGDATAKVGLLEAGFGFTPVQLSNVDAEMLLSRRFNIEEVCRWLGVPPIMIGHAAQGQTMWGSGVEAIMLSFYQLGVRPLLVRIEGAIGKRLMTPAERIRLKADFNVEGLLRADSAARASFLSTMVQNGIYTRNRARALENEPRDPSPLADALTVQSNLLPLDLLGKGTAGGSDQQARAALMNWMFGGDLNALVEQRARALIGHNGGPPLETTP